jgi:uncharacterized membrane protein YqjE
MTLDTRQHRNTEHALPEDQSVGQLVHSLAEQMSTLVRDEVKLAGTELTDKGRRAATGAGLFGGAGLLAGYAGAAVVTCLIAALARVMRLWAAALVVAGCLFALAAVLALAGRRKVKQAVPPAPAEALAGLHADVAAVKEALR